jgi:Tfp pilus assembly protein PilF
VLGFSLGVLLVAGGALAWQTQGRSLYVRWQRQQQLARAETSFRAGDFAQAARWAREVGAGDPRNLRAIEIAAESLERVGSSDSLRWWRRLADLKPQDETPLRGWAAAAFRQGDVRSAYQALRQFPRGSDSAAFHDLAGRVALSRENAEQARTHFSRALALAPDDADIQMRFAEAHVTAPQPAERERALLLLEQLATHSVHSAAALSVLTRAALQRGDALQAQRFSAQLLALPELTFEDRLVHLATLRVGQAPEYAAEFARVQTEAAADPKLLPRWLAWNTAQNLTADALKWFSALPAETQNHAPVMVAAAELYVRLGDWKGLRAWIFNAHWDQLECRRLAYQALVAARLSLGGITTAQGPWQAALKAAKAEPEHLHWLANQAEAWELWQPAETTLWLLVQKEIDADGSLERLGSLYRRLNQADGLLRVARRQLELHPGDPAFEAEVLYFSALLRVDSSQLKTLAGRVQARLAESPNSAVAYAMYLCRSGGAEEALALLDRLPIAELTAPARAALHTLLIAQVNDRARARGQLEHARREGLLAAEAALLDQAQVLARADRRHQ